MRNAKQTLSENSIIMIFSTVFVKIIGAVFKIPLATDSFLGDLGFGYFSVAHDIFMPFYILAISGLPSAVSQITASCVAKNKFCTVKSNFHLIKKLFFAMGVIFALLTAIISLPIVLCSGSLKSAVLSVFAVLPSIFLCFIMSAYRGYFEGFNNMRPTAISKIIESLCKLVLGLLLAFAVIKATNNAAYASAAALTAISIGTAFATLYLALKHKRSNPLKNIDFNESREEDTAISVKSLFAIALPYVLASISASLISFIDIITVKTYIANATTQYYESINIISSDISTHLYGIRSKAFTIHFLIPTITMSIGIAALPIITHHRTKGETALQNGNIIFAIKQISVVTLPASLGLIAFSRPIMNLLFSSNDKLSGNLLFIYGFAALVSGYAIPLTTILQAINLRKRVIRTVIIAIFIKIFSNMCLVIFPNINIYAAPIGTFLCYLYIAVDLFVLLKKHVGALKIQNTILKPFVAAAVCVAVSYLFYLLIGGKFGTVIALGMAVIIYFFMLLVLKAFTKKEVENIPFLNKIVK